jgi:hypothetical protein
LDDYYTGDTPLLEFQLDDLLCDTADEIGGTQLTGAPPVTQSTQQAQKQQHAMMVDFHDSARRAGEALAAAASVEAEARATRGGLSCRYRLLKSQRSEGAHPVGLGDSTGSDRRGGIPSGSATPQVSGGETRTDPFIMLMMHS